MKHVAFPFLTIDDRMVDATAWSLLDEESNSQAMGEYLPGWDYARDLRISRMIGLSGELDEEALGLISGKAAFSVIVRLGTGPGSLPRRSWTIARENIGPGDRVIIDQHVSGRQLSQRLRLDTTIILTGAESRGSRLAPWRPGSVLWRDEHDLMLEGSSPRFPMEIVSFRERFVGRPEAGALWHLHWRPGNLHRDFGGSVRLFLNHDRPDFIERFTGSDPQTLQCTLADVITQVLSRALLDEDLEDALADCEETSVAGHIAAWFDLAFPGENLTSIRTLHLSSPGHFHAAILAMADTQVFGEDR